MQFANFSQLNEELLYFPHSLSAHTACSGGGRMLLGGDPVGSYSATALRTLPPLLKAIPGSPAHQCAFLPLPIFLPGFLPFFLLCLMMPSSILEGSLLYCLEVMYPWLFAFF